jgi:hypothetical protein
LATKDCEKLREWARDPKSGIGPAYFVFKCPWDPKPEGVISTFMLDGVKFKIDQGLLMLPYSHPYEDRENKPIFLRVDIKDGSFTYPDNINVRSNFIIEIFSKKDFCKRNIYAKHFSCDPILTEFNCANGLTRGEKIESQIIDKNLPHGLTLYNIRYFGTNDWINHNFYIVGDVKEPDYWAACPNYLSGWCKTVVKLNDKIYFTYDFNKLEYAETQLELRDLINQLSKLIIEQ